MKVVFMGTPDFAVPTLRALTAAGHEVLAVYTQPDKPKGRGHQLALTPVKQAALDYGIPVYQPQSLKGEEAAEEIRSLSPDVIVVVAYGQLLPVRILEIPPYGCINVHASLLPKYRGAGPIAWSVIDGEEKTGVTTMYMAKGLDTGDILLTKETPIGPEETTGEVHDRLAGIGAQALLETLEGLANKTISPIKQDDTLATYAPKLTKELGNLDFSQPPKQLCSLIRGLSPWPGAYTTVRGKTLKIWRASIAQGRQGMPGEVLDDKQLIVGCNGGALLLSEVQMESKKRMSAEEFMRGYQLKPGEKLGG